MANTLRGDDWRQWRMLAAAVAAITRAVQSGRQWISAHVLALRKSPKQLRDEEKQRRKQIRRGLRGISSIQ